VPTKIFEPASKPLAGYREWDSLYPEVVRSLMPQLGQPRTDVTFEHVGSTAVAGCGGKGVIDLLALYLDGALDEAKSWLLSLGLVGQGTEFSRAWPESRPMYLGWYQYGGKQWLVYVHVVNSASDEVRRFRDFRDLLAGSAELIAEYCELKRSIVTSGVSDTDEYAARKRSFFRSALGARHGLMVADSLPVSAAASVGLIER
jgi:GrpB-like predicted nucleotidyltransferase (UPF0157 family)